ncbi:hypothetical protein PIB30_106664 [Stylosanthes scabra]|uniref:Uncharacterized protein n=1 Tax=Stylosanthes scabra TaxID=79078 RepID=A0ABU6XYF9_9FABA|nr:hypothetical protein [Stylosanthes scabra]
MGKHNIGGKELSACYNREMEICKFEELCRFSRICQGAPEGYEEWKCLKYQDGLRDDIMRVVVPLQIKSFAELVNTSRVIEECSKKTMVTSNNRRGYHNQGKGRSFSPRGQNFKRGGYTQQPQQG